jgi:hypothetical protein
VDGKAKVTGLVLAGYLLGRTKKLKLALTIAGAVGGKQLMNNKDELLGQVTKLVQSSPETRRLVEQVSVRLLDAAKGAAIAGASKRIESVSNNLQSRADRLNAGVGEAAGKAAEAGKDAAGMATEAGKGAAGTAAAGAGAAGAGVAKGLRSVTHPFKSRAERRQAAEEETEERPEGEEEYAEEERPEGEEQYAEEERPEGEEEPEAEQPEEEQPEAEAAEEEPEAEQPEEEQPQGRQQRPEGRGAGEQPRSESRPAGQPARKPNQQRPATPRPAPKEMTGAAPKAAAPKKAEGAAKSEPGARKPVPRSGGNRPAASGKPSTR